ncbi:glutathione S-transferase [Protomyces lactucae-debilis]|uniref:Glutathione S-transferase n=1 Tax=Protomyces lactucae-debilis TaxID=2754530 RepID=A0A1Y2FQT9_PROLT|nr:glutathione S-transferase [Protomyces lactucae-debilis]ORY86353.1 glutathione S-transferase [Protomyces lactucae-debilis]
MLTIHHLGNSRSFRIVWLLNELALPYTLKSYPRINNKAPDALKSQHKLGKAPLLEDNGKQIIESGNIVEYLYRKKGIEISDEARMWVHYAESTLMVHALAVLYARWSLPNDPEQLAKCESFMGINVQLDLDYVNAHLEGRDFLEEGTLTAADIMLAFSCEIAIVRKLGTGGKTWPNVERWLKSLAQREAYRKAQKEAQHELSL